MAYTIREFQKYVNRNRKAIRQETYRSADEEVNGKTSDLELISTEIESFPIFHRPVRGC